MMTGEGFHQGPTFRTLTHRPDPLQFLADDLLWIILCAAGFLYGGTHVTLPRTCILVCSAFLSACLLYRYISLRRCRYILSAEVLVYDRGIFTRAADYIELYRVVDYRERQTFLQQILGIKTVVVYSGDRTHPELTIPGVSVSADVIPVIRERVEYNKRKKAVYEITNR